MTSAAPQPYGNPNAPVGASDRYNVLAIVGFVLAFVFSIAGLVVSIIALSQIKRTGERGHGLALAGVIISAVSIVLGIIGGILFSVAPAHRRGVRRPACPEGPLSLPGPQVSSSAASGRAPSSPSSAAA